MPTRKVLITIKALYAARKRNNNYLFCSDDIASLQKLFGDKFYITEENILKAKTKIGLQIEEPLNVAKLKEWKRLEQQAQQHKDPDWYNRPNLHLAEYAQQIKPLLEKAFMKIERNQRRLHGKNWRECSRTR